MRVCVCVCVCGSPALSRTSDLLGLNSEQLAEVLTHRSMILRGEEISTPLTVEQVGTRRRGRHVWVVVVYVLFSRFCGIVATREKKHPTFLSCRIRYNAKVNVGHFGY